MNIKAIFSKPFSVIWYRFTQMIFLTLYVKINFWQRTEKEINKKIHSSKHCWKEKSQLYVEDPFDNNSYSDPALKATIREHANAILAGHISIFDIDYCFTTPLAWNIDWRVNYEWPNTYFKNYNFYEKNKPLDYDVKFPWERSRLHFLIPVAKGYLHENTSKYIDYIFDILSDWKKKNPMAHSVNWYPMEVSVRIINLIQLRALLLLGLNTDTTIDLLNEILLLHGIFLWRNIEYTDIRGNHYSANLTALLLLGKTYRKYYAEAGLWYNYALKNIENEFHLQFLDDGVNFEKSIPYHRLVVEFYLISFIVMQRSGINLHSRTLEKFKAACNFIKDYTKPNRLIPVIGDNDSASVLQYDGLALNDHANLLQLASLFLNDNSINNSPKIYYTSIAFFGMKNAKALSCNTPNNLENYDYYAKGGFAIIKNNKNYFITDIGEAGMQGRGGHAHNDLFSFELMYDHNDLIIDPGVYTYTGNLDVKQLMRSSAYHNILQVDDEEIIPLIGHWGMAATAPPYNVVVDKNETTMNITGKHDGYKRLQDPVEHTRTFKIDTKTFKIQCTDVLYCEGVHEIKRHLHFSEKVTLAIENDRIFAVNEGLQYVISYDEESKPQITDYILSYRYGTKTTSKKITLKTKIKKTSTLYFTIEKIGNHE